MSLHEISPSDIAALTPPVRRFWVGLTGSVRLQLAGDAAPVTLGAVQAGQWVEFENAPVAFIFETGTTARDIIGST